MSDFFELPPPPPEPPHPHRSPEWFGPPDNVLGVVVPLGAMLARTDDLALALRSVDVYRGGAVFDVVLLLHEPAADPMDFMPFHRRRAELGEDVFRLGVQYADGAKATNLGVPFFPRAESERPPGPVLMPRGSGGGGHRWDLSFWLWPLPAEDPFALVVEWPARGIELTRKEIPVAPLVDAAARCEDLWPRDDGADGGSWTSVSFTRTD